MMNIPLVKMLSQLESFKIFLAEVNDEIVGCIHALDYVYDCGYIGGLLVHKDFRRMGIGGKLLKTALSSLRAKYVYLFVEEKNTVAINLFEKTGFKKIYRRLLYTVSVPLNNGFKLQITSEVEWEGLKNAIGFLERKGIVNFGYYPIKMTRNVFEDLKAKGKVLRCGGVIAIIENLHGLIVGDNLYTFNDYVFKHLQKVDFSRKIVEINPFYIEPEPSDLVSLINHLLTLGEVHIKTYDRDPVVIKLPLAGKIGALTMEYKGACTQYVYNGGGLLEVVDTQMYYGRKAPNQVAELFGVHFYGDLTMDAVIVNFDHPITRDKKQEDLFNPFLLYDAAIDRYPSNATVLVRAGVKD
ncbi:MAG: GNAT family N-acetyltransferase [Candidatus Brockarchaeota archaeon]|nr:GNAT family N-acetyltransferase [Candidatus Brockarchaeota archaeon]